MSYENYDRDNRIAEAREARAANRGRGYQLIGFLVLMTAIPIAAYHHLAHDSELPWITDYVLSAAVIGGLYAAFWGGADGASGESSQQIYHRRWH